jgi:hypothetical protein
MEQWELPATTFRQYDNDRHQRFGVVMSTPLASYIGTGVFSASILINDQMFTLRLMHALSDLALPKTWKAGSINDYNQRCGKASKVTEIKDKQYLRYTPLRFAQKKV